MEVLVSEIGEGENIIVQYTYQYLYDTAGSNINAVNSIAGINMTPPYTFQIPDEDQLHPGETFTLNYFDENGDPASVTATYDGMNAASGSPYITINGQDGFLSTTEQSLGAGTAPELDNTTSPLCFLPGTLIATPGGLIAVEDLSAGDLVLTADGRATPVKWMGRQTIATLFGMAESLRPVRISAGALGPDLPVRDLRLTTSHALVLDGLLVQAGALVNGTSIRRMEMGELGDRFIVYHIELEGHDVVLADGVPAETFVDNVSRMRFDNYGEFEAVFGAPIEMMTELEPPRVKSARQLPAAIRKRVADRAAELLPRVRAAV